MHRAASARTGISRAVRAIWSGVSSSASALSSGSYIFDGLSPGQQVIKIVWMFSMNQIQV